MSSLFYVEITEKFPERLRQIRLDKGLTQAELAEKISVPGDYVSQVTISQYERGIVAPPSPAFSRLGQALGVSLDWLAGRTDDPKVHQKRTK